MFSSRIASLVIIGSLVSFSTAMDHTGFIFYPSKTSWWVDYSDNNIKFHCNDTAPASEYTVLVNHPSFEQPQAIIAVLQNADCVHTVPASLCNFTPSTNYTLIFADVLNSTNVYTTSSQFEIKSQGSEYPSASDTTTDGLASSTSGTVSASSTVSKTGSSSSVTGTTKLNGAIATFKVSAAGVLAAMGVAVGMI